MVDQKITRIRKKRRVRKHLKKGILSAHQVVIGKVRLFHIIVALILALIVGAMVLRYVENESGSANIEQN